MCHLISESEIFYSGELCMLLRRKRDNNLILPLFFTTLHQSHYNQIISPPPFCRKTIFRLIRYQTALTCLKEITQEALQANSLLSPHLVILSKNKRPLSNTMSFQVLLNCGACKVELENIMSRFSQMFLVVYIPYMSMNHSLKP